MLYFIIRKIGNSLHFPFCSYFFFSVLLRYIESHFNNFGHLQLLYITDRSNAIFVLLEPYVRFTFYLSSGTRVAAYWGITAHSPYDMFSLH